MSKIGEKRAERLTAVKTIVKKKRNNRSGGETGMTKDGMAIPIAVSFGDSPVKTADCKLMYIYIHSGIRRRDASTLLMTVKRLCRVFRDYSPGMEIDDLCHIADFASKIGPDVEYWRADYTDPDDSSDNEGATKKLHHKIRILWEENIDEGFSLCEEKDDRVSFYFYTRSYSYKTGDKLHHVRVTYDAENYDGLWKVLVNGV